tara:strand:+ start:622 stop:1404 length:783 start_codon:yes stop_codon:yes gene_type:complete
MDGVLYSEEFGSPEMPTIVCLHGLLGSSRNWRSVAKDLSHDFRVFALDLRNHGESFHQKDASVKAMAGDLHLWLDDQNLASVILCGHSLGGKVAMRFACDHPKRIEKLVVADIAPRDYPPEHHLPTLDALLGLDLGNLQSRKEADEALVSKVPNWAFRQFLLTNLAKREESFYWKPNLLALRASMNGLSSNPLQSGEAFDGLTLFVRGGKSGYLRTEHLHEVEKHFPNSQMEVLPEAGHDLHIEDRPGFIRVVRDFLSLV